MYVYSVQIWYDIWYDIWWYMMILWYYDDIWWYVEIHEHDNSWKLPIFVHFLLSDGQSESVPLRLAPAQRATLAALRAGETQASSAIVAAAEVAAWQPGRPGTLWWTNIAMERSTIFHMKIHYKWPFSIAMLVHQRVLSGLMGFHGNFNRQK